MPLESHHKLSVRTKRQKSSAEKVKAEALLKRVRGMIDQENLKDRHKFAQETRGNLKEFLRQMKPKNAPKKGAYKEEGGINEGDLKYEGLGGISVKNDEGTMSMRAAGLTFGNNKGKIVFGATHSSQRDMPGEESQGHAGIGFAGSFKF